MEIEAQLESLDSKIEKNGKKTDKLSKLVTSLANSVEQSSSSEEIKILFNEMQKDYSKNQKGLNKKITELKTAITKANDTIENFSQNSVENIDINKLYNLFDEFKTSTDLSNKAVNNGVEKIENLLTEYNQNLNSLNQLNQTSVEEKNIKDAIKNLNDEFYLDLLQLFNSFSFEEEAEDLKDFMEEIISSVTLKTDENTEKLNSIMLQFKNLLNKIEGIEKAQNSISDYLKPEDESELVYSFDDIQSDLAKMRLVLNDISNSQDIVEEISEKIKQTSEQIENISKLLETNNDSEEWSFNINKKIEDLNEQVYDISMRTNKLLLSNEDSNIELKNNLELFKEVFDKANPEKIYELFYELTHYFNDVTERINDVTSTTKASHTEAVTIKNALVYVGEWLDNATNVLEEMRTGINELKTKEFTPQTVQNNNNDIVQSIEELKTGIVHIINKIPSTSDGIKSEEIKKITEDSIGNIYTRLNELEANTQARLDVIENKLAEILEAKPKETTSRTATTHLKNIDKKFEEMQETLSRLSAKLGIE